MKLKSLTLVLTLTLSVLSVTAREIHISPSGSDSAIGTRAAPLLTLRAAKMRIRKIKYTESFPKTGISVIYG